MARISKDKSKNVWKVFYEKFGGGRSSICIGNITGPKRIGKKSCDKILRIVNQLEEAQRWGVDPEAKVMEEISGLSKKVISKIENTGLLPRKVYIELGDLQNEWAESLKGEVKKNTIKGYVNNTIHLVDYLGSDRPVGSITPFDVDKFPEYLIEEKELSGGTPTSIIVNCRTFFNFAIRKGYLSQNPLTGIKAKKYEYAKSIMISEEHRERLLAAARTDEERLLVALWSYCGMRRREPSMLKWDECRFAEVDGETVPTQFLVHEYKITSGGEARKRICPAFEKVFPHLLQLWKSRDRNSPWIFANPRWRFEHSAVFCTLMKTLHNQAGLERPERLFCNLRATASEECVAAYGTARENEWLGHTEEVRRRHYRPELSTEGATNEALGFLDGFDIAGGADVVQQQDAARSNAEKDVIVEAQNYSVFRRVAAGCDSVQEPDVSRLRSRSPTYPERPQLDCHLRHHQDTFRTTDQ